MIWLQSSYRLVHLYGLTLVNTESSGKLCTTVVAADPTAYINSWLMIQSMFVWLRIHQFEMLSRSRFSIPLDPLNTGTRLILIEFGSCWLMGQNYWWIWFSVLTLGSSGCTSLHLYLCIRFLAGCCVLWIICLYFIQILVITDLMFFSADHWESLHEWSWIG